MNPRQEVSFAATELTISNQMQERGVKMMYRDRRKERERKKASEKVNYILYSQVNPKSLSQFIIELFLSFDGFYLLMMMLTYIHDDFEKHLPSFSSMFELKALKNSKINYPRIDMGLEASQETRQQ